MKKAERSRYALFEKIDMAGGDPDKCWLFKGATGGSDGRPYARLNGKLVLVYREIYQLFYGVELKPNEQLLHECDTPACCNPKHLHPGTLRENMEDMSKKGRARNGNGNGRIPIGAIRLIRKRLKEGFPHSHIVLDIQEQFGLKVSKSTVAHINNNITYRGVGLDETPET
jgi:hypothetical protein